MCAPVPFLSSAIHHCLHIMKLINLKVFVPLFFTFYLSGFFCSQLEDYNVKANPTIQPIWKKNETNKKRERKLIKCTLKEPNSMKSQHWIVQFTWGYVHISPLTNIFSVILDKYSRCSRTGPCCERAKPKSTERWTRAKPAKAP